MEDIFAELDNDIGPSSEATPMENRSENYVEKLNEKVSKEKEKNENLISQVSELMKEIHQINEPEGREPKEPVAETECEEGLPEFPELMEGDRGESHPEEVEQQITGAMKEQVEEATDLDFPELLSEPPAEEKPSSPLDRIEPEQPGSPNQVAVPNEEMTEEAEFPELLEGAGEAIPREKEEAVPQPGPVAIEMPDLDFPELMGDEPELQGEQPVQEKEQLQPEIAGRL